MTTEELCAYKQLTALHYELEQKVKRGGSAEDKQKLREVNRRLGKISSFILECSDPLIKQMLILKFTKFLSWEAVAAKVGGYNSADSCRMLVLRYIGRENRK